MNAVSSDRSTQDRALKLSTGRLFPKVGLGTWKIPKSAAAQTVLEALRCGYRHLDCASDYGNEAEVGAGIAQALASGVCKREDLWVTSKLWNTYHHREHVRPALERTLRDLRLEYVDLYLIHFPISMKFVPFEHRYPAEWFYNPKAPAPCMEPDPVPIRETWEAMEALADSGLARHIGVSNFGASLLRDLLSYARIRPAVLQIELHPYLTQEKLLRYCRDEGIAVTGFSPLGAPSYLSLGMATSEESVIDTEAVRAIARHHGKTPAQVALRWGVQRGTAIVPKTVQPERLKENIALFDFELSPSEMNTLSALNRNRRFNDPGDFCERAFGRFFPIYE